MSIYLGDKLIAGATDKELDKFITNCITEIPQDIKLELNNGTLTLKAGSKVTYLDESTQIIASDVSTPGVSFTGECFVFYNNGILFVRAISQVSSGTSTPTSAVSGKNIYFNTNTKKVHAYSNNQWVEVAFSLPLGTITLQNSSPYIKSFNKTFNGFGYIGSTVFVLPGVKGLIPNGRNADGTLKNIEFTTDKVFVLTETGTNNYSISINQNGLGNSSVMKYDADKNLNYNSANNTVMAGCNAGKFTRTSGVVSNFQPKTTFHAVDYFEFKNTPHIVETYVNGTNWYRVYSDGWIEQGGFVVGLGTTISLLQPMSNNTYTCLCCHNGSGAKGEGVIHAYNKTTTSFKTGVSIHADDMYGFSWYVCGY